MIFSGATLGVHCPLQVWNSRIHFQEAFLIRGAPSFLPDPARRCRIRGHGHDARPGDTREEATLGREREGATLSRAGRGRGGAAGDLPTGEGRQVL